MSADWTQEAAWLHWPSSGRTWVNPQTKRETLPDGRVRLTAHKVSNWFIEVPADHPLATS